MNEEWFQIKNGWLVFSHAAVRIECISEFSYPDGGGLRISCNGNPVSWWLSAPIDDSTNAIRLSSYNQFADQLFQALLQEI